MQPAPRLAGASQPRALLTQSSTSNTPQAAQAEPSAQLTLTSAQHLSEAKRALADGYKLNRDPKKAQWEEVAAAKWHLKAIGAAEAEYREAQELLQEVARRERQIELARKQAEAEKSAETTAPAAAAEVGSDEASSAVTPSPASTIPPAATAARQSPPPTTTGRGLFERLLYEQPRRAGAKADLQRERASRGRDRAVQGRELQLQPEPAGDVLAPRWGVEVALIHR
jgi:hypothetical protein